ncbi:rhomboid family intramembrane serine protease [Haliangium ochraceum]|uniref:Rhomboid family protein n=1 Tax=Haliangium ochraceum (strain DSM 14365 / JCM 11303 / SMP-2) TaxID=502025 RepID=D0LG54_HALO1|nr:rhomboid family intramembrane serine protease [Haliangium ochraceum]ACY18079.1 Rhomboid family protein [Haliangium ochraceum DSM 14365]
MFLPIGDEPNAPRTPVVTYALLGINIAVYLFITLPMGSDSAEYQRVAESWGYRAAAPSPLTLLSSMFLHADIWHLLGNMLYLWIYGDNVEHRLGPLGYIGVYLAGGAVATLSYAAFLSPALMELPLVGASGAISALLGFYFVWFPKNRVRVFILFRVWRIRAPIVLGIYVLWDNVLPLLITASSDGVAYGAHLGGFFGGVIGALLISFFGERKFQHGHLSEQAVNELREHPPQQLAADAAPATAKSVSALASSNPEAAMLLYETLSPSERQRVPAELLDDIADELASHGEHEAAQALYHRVAAQQPGSQAGVRAMLAIGHYFRDIGHPARAYQYYYAIAKHDPRSPLAEQARQAMLDLEHHHRRTNARRAP